MCSKHWHSHAKHQEYLNIIDSYKRYEKVKTDLFHHSKTMSYTEIIMLDT